MPYSQRHGERSCLFELGSGQARRDGCDGDHLRRSQDAHCGCQQERRVCATAEGHRNALKATKSLIEVGETRLQHLLVEGSH